MGYMDLTLNGSDQAADAASYMIQGMSKHLRKTLKEKQNAFNTSGPVNVAMIFDELIIPAKYHECYSEDLLSLAIDAHDQLKAEYDRAKIQDWSFTTKADKQEHLDAYQRLLRRMNTFIKKCEEL